jgi:LmbE family N-acetylglucosaminyl deacetylase
LTRQQALPRNLNLSPYSSLFDARLEAVRVDTTTTFEQNRWRVCHRSVVNGARKQVVKANSEDIEEWGELGTYFKARYGREKRSKATARFVEDFGEIRISQTYP